MNIKASHQTLVRLPSESGEHTVHSFCNCTDCPNGPAYVQVSVGCIAVAAAEENETHVTHDKLHTLLSHVSHLLGTLGSLFDERA